MEKRTKEDKMKMQGQISHLKAKKRDLKQILPHSIQNKHILLVPSLVSRPVR